jgi:hypothetical protein
LVISLTAGLIWSDCSATADQALVADIAWSTLSYGLGLGMLLSFAGVTIYIARQAWRGRKASCRQIVEH